MVTVVLPTGLAVENELAAMQLDNGFDKIQTEATALISAIVNIARLPERLQHFFLNRPEKFRYLNQRWRFPHDHQPFYQRSF